MWNIIPQEVVAILTAAAMLFAATWGKSPFSLLDDPYKRWLRALIILGTAVIFGILSAWFTDCSYLGPLTILSAAAMILCAVLMVTHYRLRRKTSAASTRLVVICIGWSILGTLASSSLSAMLIAKKQMDDEYKNNPLRLWQFEGGKKREPRDIIYLTSKLKAHFVGEMVECHNIHPEMKLYPEIGELKNGTYTAPERIEEEQYVTIEVKSKWYQQTKTARIMLLPDPDNVKRTPYPGKDGRGREAVFDLIIISQNDSWVFRSDEFVVKNRLSLNERLPGTLQQTPVCQPILKLAESDAFDPYVDVICIGTASREGGQVEEDDRASRRSKRIAEWVNLALNRKNQSKNVYTMNLGQYDPMTKEKKALTADETAPERPVVIIGVVRAGEIDLREGLRNVFEAHQENSIFNSLATHYRRRDIALYKELPRAMCPQP